jgi:glycerol-3-phosphate dehydrogenase
MAVQDAFPSLDLREKDIQATFSGIRSVVDTGKQDPSKESREHALWWEDGLLTITGGKLTTFRLMARQALKSISNLLTIKYGGTKNHQLLNTPPWDEMSQANISPDLRLRILGRYGIDAIDIINSSIPAELTTISNLPVLWSELRWAARSEGVVHLDDLLLRRVRLGLLLPDGGIHYLDRIQSIVQEELGWNNSRWAAEVQRYLEIWTKYYNYAE